MPLENCGAQLVRLNGYPQILQFAGPRDARRRGMTIQTETAPHETHCSTDPVASRQVLTLDGQKSL